MNLKLKGALEELQGENTQLKKVRPAVFTRPCAFSICARVFSQRLHIEEKSGLL